MAETLEGKLNQLPFVKNFREKWARDRTSLGCDHPGEYFTVTGRDAFWYDSVSRNVNLLRPNEDGRDFGHTVLVLEDPPLFEVGFVRSSRTGSLLALVGRHGISVMVSPEVVAPMPSKVLCRSIRVAQHLLVTNPKLEVVEAKFHPGSVSDSHLVVLCSDNYLRIFEMSDALTPEQVIPLGRSSTVMLSSLSMTTMQASMGEVGMSFDFGLPLLREESSNGPRVVNSVMATSATIASAFVWWPIFVLRGDCEIFYVLTAVGAHRSRRAMVQGPLTVRPDIRNYSAETANIMCLQTNPAILVISTADAYLLHAVVLPSAGGPVDDFVGGDEDPADLMSRLSIIPNESSTVPENFRVSVQIFEALALDVPLRRSIAGEKRAGDEGSAAKPATSSGWCPHSGTIYGTEFWNSYLVGLHRDDYVVERYYVTHPTGVHCVSLPCVRQFREFVDSPGNDLTFGPDEAPSRIGQLVCTRMSFPPSFEPEPIAGFGIVPPRVFILFPPSDGYKMCVQRHGPVWQFSELLSVAKDKEKLSPSRVSDLRDHGASQSFVDHIGKILERNQNLPLLRLSGGLDSSKQLTPVDIWNLLRAATQVLREEYFVKFSLARVEMRKRSEKLAEILSLQSERLRKFTNDFERLSARNNALLDRGVELFDAQKPLVARAEAVYQALMSRAPVVTRAEKAMQKEVSTTQAFLADYKQQLAFVEQALKELASKGSPTSAVFFRPRMSLARFAELSKAFEIESKALLALLRMASALQKKANSMDYDF